MKMTLLLSTLTAASVSMLSASEAFKEDLKKNRSKEAKTPIKAKDVLQKHTIGSIETANEQDELSADVQDLIQEQTNPKVLKLLNEAEDLMGEATERLENKKTGGATIAIETEIIEKIYAAAKQKKKDG